MKKAVQKVQLLKNMTKIIAAGDFTIILKKLQQSLQGDLSYFDKHCQKTIPLISIIRKYYRQDPPYFGFISELSIEHFRKKEIVFESGDIGRKMYFILDGTMQVLPTLNSPPSKELIVGDHFGEVSLHHRIPRTATVVCKTDCTVLVLGYEGYQKYLYQIFENMMHDKYKHLKPASIFYSWTQLTLALIVHHLKEVTFSRNHYVYKEGTNDLNFYIVKSGEICIQKNLHKKLESGLICLGPGQCFGDYEFLKHGQEWYKQREQLSHILRETDAKALTPTEVFIVPIHQYLSICEEYHPSVLKSFLRSSKQTISERIEKLSARKLETEQDVIQSPSTTNLMNNIMQLRVKQSVTPIEPILLKFDKNYKILLMKTLRDKCNIIQPVQDTFRRGLRSSLQKYRQRIQETTNINNTNSGIFIRSYKNHKSSLGSLMPSPNTSQSFQRKTSLHNILKSGSIQRSTSQADIRKNCFKFEISSGYRFRGSNNL